MKDLQRKGVKTIPLLFRAFNLSLISLFIISVFFPYLQILPTGTDVQPYALVFSVLIVVLFLPKIKVPLAMVLLMIVMLFSFALGMYYGLSIEAIRSVLNYTSLFFISSATYFIFRSRKIDMNFTLWVVVIVWFLVGLIQRFVNVEFMQFVLPRASGALAGGRGVIGLAPEPSYYGIFCIFIMLMVFASEIGRKPLLIFLLLVQILLFSMSPMAGLFLAIWMFCYIVIYFPYGIFNNWLVEKNYFKVILVVFFSTILLFVLSQQITNTRILKLAALFIQNPFGALFLDQSMNERFLHIYFSMVGFVENYGLPHGFIAFQAYLAESYSRFGDLVIWNNMTNRIMSAYGAALFELGIFGIFVPIAVTMTIVRRFKGNFKAMMLYCLFTNTILLAAIPLSFPPLGFLLGCLSATGVLNSTEPVPLHNNE